MKVIHLARKPLSEGTVASNVQMHGVGSINIDASRIGAGGSTTPSGMDRLNARGAALGYRPDAYTQGTPSAPAPQGRWPANVVLEHLQACDRAGTRSVKTDTHFPSSRPAGSQLAGPTGHKGQEGLEDHSPGTEQVEAWCCAPGCPVAHLDEQMPVAGAFAPVATTSTPKTQHIFGKFEGNGDDGRTFQGDKGGASRFFKQVQRAD